MPRVLAALILAFAACGAPPADGGPSPMPSVAEETAVAVHPARLQLDGRSFPDHVLALTWDDGPDANTLRLADYLASHRVSATFFVVDEWSGDLSAEPGIGPHEFETGYAFIPILGDLVALGHRLGNHTANHVLLASAKAAVVDFELRENQRRIDPFLTNELRVFRSPGGAWDEDAGAVVDRDPALDGIVGPVRWDIDRKDWESSLYCRSSVPALECEPAAPGQRSRVRAEVTAERYLDSIRKAGHGIVLFHDRVGDVGSDYALRVARHVIPALETSGFVFAAPMLAFSSFRPRAGDPLTSDWLTSLDASSVVFADVDGDGRADVCGVGTGGFGCARSVERPGSGDDRRPETFFEWSAAWSGSVRPVGRGPVASELSGDLNGDGLVDVCQRTNAGVTCAFNSRRGMLASGLWLAAIRDDARVWLTPEVRLVLADVNGDGRADLCGIASARIGCALAP